MREIFVRDPSSRNVSIGTVASVCIGLVLGFALLVAASSVGSAQEKSDTVRIDPGEHAAVQIDFRDGPSSDVSYEVQATDGPNIDVLVMNNANYQAYQQGDDFEYIEDWSDLDTGSTQAEFLLQEHGTWWLVLDHSSEPDDGASPATIGAQSVTANYTLSVDANLEEELQDRWSNVPDPSVGAVILVASGVALVQARRSP